MNKLRDFLTMNRIERKTGTLLVFITAFLASSTCAVELVPMDLRCEYRINPLGIDNVTPRLSWKLIDPDKTRGQKQKSFQVLVASTLEKLNQGIGDVWESTEIQDSDSVNRVYRGPALKSGQQCFWKVRVRDASNRLSTWSEPARFSIGLIQSSDWNGQWIYKPDQLKTDHNWYRKNFTLETLPSSAMAYIASFGYHELYVNGEKVTDHVMNPASSYMKERIPYLTYDISPHLKEGDNVIGIWHAAGWSRWRRIREYRNIPFVFKAQVEITDGEDHFPIGSDTSWKCKKSHSEYYGDWDILRFGGETVDDRRKEEDWNTASYDDSNWTNASVYNAAELNAKLPEGDNISFAINGAKDHSLRVAYRDIKAKLSAQMVEPQVRFKEVNPIAIHDNQDGTYRIDMGENYTGFFEIDLHGGTEGDRVFFEISDQLEKTVSYFQKSEYVFGSEGEGTFSNRFNVAGGRWITVTGLTYKPELKDIRGYVITSNRKRISQFECSNELLNKIYETNLNTYLANTLDGILMDCPHRERRGWGEVTVAAMYGDALPNFESGAYMDQYTQYMRDAQFSDGQIRAIINEEDRPFLMWKANSPITVWETYRMLGDRKILRDNYASMKKWMTWLLENSDYENGGALIVGEQGKREFPGLGDWCTPKGNFWDSSNSPEAAHFNNCLYAYMLDCALKVATALEENDDAKVFSDRLKVQRNATHQMSYDPTTGDYGNGQQVNQAFALVSGVTPESEKKKVYDNLVDETLYAFPYYDTGSSGQALYTRYFTEHGERMDLIYELLTDRGHPSYGYFLDQGETVWPERWSSLGGSRIHTCYTGIGSYFVKGFGGIRSDSESPGMRDFIIKPAPVGELQFANTEFESMYGNIVVHWERGSDSARYHVEIPVNCSAKIYLPATGKQVVNESDVPAESSEGVEYVGTEKSDAVGNYVIYRLASGIYDFQVSQVPETAYPDPLHEGSNLSRIGRMTGSSMKIASEKIPGFEAFKANDNDVETCWRANAANDQWLEVAWLKPQEFKQVVIKEIGDHIASYRIQYWTGSQWAELASGSTCGVNKTETFKPVQSTKCRLMIDKASSPASIAEFEVLRSPQ